VRRLALALLAGLAARAEAQAAGRIDVGVGGSDQRRPGVAALWSVAPSLLWQTGPFRFRAEGEYGEFAVIGQGAQGQVEGSWFGRAGPALLVELTGQARGTALRSGTRGQGDAGTRLHLAGARRGLWAGAQAGRDGRGPTVRWEAAAWQRFGDLWIQVQGSQTSAIDLVLRDGAAPDTLTPQPDTLYREQVRVHTDIGTWLHWRRGPMQLAGALGRRFGVAEPAGGLQGSPGNPADPTLGLTTRKAGAVTWWSLEGRLWITEQVGLLAAGGYQPPDGSLRTPGGRFLRLGLSAALPRGGRGATGTAVLLAPRPRAAVELRPLEGGFQELFITAPAAQEVELMGDFTDWLPVPLVAAGGGRWRLRLRLPPGMYGMNVRYDRGAWLVPPGLPVMKDDYGGESGVLVVR
jgi:hypothetical protein